MQQLRQRRGCRRRSGNRSAQAAKKLIAIGYTNVSDFGGIIDWPYDVVTD